MENALRTVRRFAKLLIENKLPYLPVPAAQAITNQPYLIDYEILTDTSTILLF